MTLPCPIQRSRRLPAKPSLALLLGACGVAPLPGAEQFWLFTRPLVIPERGAVTGYVLQTARERYCFMPPPGWAVKENAATRDVVMMEPSLTTSIRFKIVPAPPESPAATGVEEEREAILDQYPDARVIAEFPCYTGLGEGQGFDLKRTAADRLRISTRLAVVPLAGGRVEFNLTTPAGKLEEFHLAFGNFLTSFTVESVRTN